MAAEDSGSRPRRSQNPRKASGGPRSGAAPRGGKPGVGSRPGTGGKPKAAGERGYGRGGTRGDGRSDRGGAGREFTEAQRLQHELRPVRASHKDPEIPDTVTAKDLHPGARNELKTLDKDLADLVARHLAMVGILIDTEPELAHQHALSASRRAGRIPVTRETLAITSYVLGDYATALRELRTYRRLSGSENQLAMMIDCERGLGRPERGLEIGRSVPREKLATDVQVQVAIAMSGARLDLGQTQQALFELEIAQLDPSTAYSWSPELFASYANVLEDLGRTEEAALWHARAVQAETALEEEFGEDDTVDVLEIVEAQEAEPEQDVTPEEAGQDA